MPGNTFGQLFKITTFGESHGLAVGCVIDGMPSNFELSESDIQPDLDKRKPGQSHLTTARQEKDQVKIKSGVFEGKTTGAPILLLVNNEDKRSEDYLDIKDLFRPSHADFTYQAKYGIRDWQGGGRASARETVARVAAGAVAKKFLQEKLSVEFLTFIESVGEVKASINYQEVKASDIEASLVRCPSPEDSQRMIELIEKTKAEGDSIGGVVFGVIKKMPKGLGEPVFDKLSADLAKAMLSIGAVKGFEYGRGFLASTMKGSEHNDEFYIKDSQVRTKTNNSGGIQGGISNGEDIYFRVAFKPTATIAKNQNTIGLDGQAVVVKASGRHDPCVAIRAVAVVEAMGAITVMDHYLRNK
ncbi:MAG: chorismate synthase [bacterium]|nr:chorismate synthase [bacterium]